MKKDLDCSAKEKNEQKTSLLLDWNYCKYFRNISFGLYCYDKWTEVKYEGELKTYYGDTRVIFGSNIFIGTPNILVVNEKPIFTSAVKNGKLFISIIIFDRDGKVVAQIDENKWFINKNNYFRMDISNSEIKVTNQQGEVALDAIALPDGAVKVNGTFYIGGRKIIATDQGLTIMAD
jgi:hypothetical protein